VLSRTLFENVNSLFANESDGYKTRLEARRAPFGFPAEGALGPGKSRLPSKVNAIIETAIKKIYLTDVADVIEEVQLQCFKANTKKPHPQPIQRPSLTV
jgi:hypothetical protein